MSAVGVWLRQQEAKDGDPPQPAKTFLNSDIRLSPPPFLNARLTLNVTPTSSVSC